MPKPIALACKMTKPKDAPLSGGRVTVEAAERSESDSVIVEYGPVKTLGLVSEASTNTVP